MIALCGAVGLGAAACGADFLRSFSDFGGFPAFGSFRSLSDHGVFLASMMASLRPAVAVAACDGSSLDALSAALATQAATVRMLLEAQLLGAAARGILCRCGTTCWPLPARDARPWPPPGTDLRSAPQAAAADDGAAARLADDPCDRGRQVPATAVQVTAAHAMPRHSMLAPVGSRRDASLAIGANARSRSAGSSASELPSVHSEPAFRTVDTGGRRRVPRLVGRPAGTASRTPSRPSQTPKATSPPGNRPTATSAAAP